MHLQSIEFQMRNALHRDPPDRVHLEELCRDYVELREICTRETQPSLPPVSLDIDVEHEEV